MSIDKDGARRLVGNLKTEVMDFSTGVSRTTAGEAVAIIDALLVELLASEERCRRIEEASTVEEVRAENERFRRLITLMAATEREAFDPYEWQRTLDQSAAHRERIQQLDHEILQLNEVIVRLTGRIDRRELALRELTTRYEDLKQRP